MRRAPIAASCRTVRPGAYSPITAGVRQRQSSNSASKRRRRTRGSPGRQPGPAAARGKASASRRDPGLARVRNSPGAAHADHREGFSQVCPKARVGGGTRTPARRRRAPGRRPPTTRRGNRPGPVARWRTGGLIDGDRRVDPQPTTARRRRMADGRQPWIPPPGRMHGVTGSHLIPPHRAFLKGRHHDAPRPPLGADPRRTTRP